MQHFLFLTSPLLAKSVFKPADRYGDDNNEQLKDTQAERQEEDEKEVEVEVASVVEDHSSPRREEANDASRKEEQQVY